MIQIFVYINFLLGIFFDFLLKTPAADYKALSYSIFPPRELSKFPFLAQVNLFCVFFLLQKNPVISCTIYVIGSQKSRTILFELLCLEYVILFPTCCRNYTGITSFFYCCFTIRKYISLL